MQDADKEAPPGAKASTVLVIDDAPMVRQLATAVLRKSGYRVLEAANGAEGFELALQHRPDLALCDIHMPVLDGWGFVAQARAHEALHTLPILMLTASQDRESARRAMSTGADDFLTKPWTPAELRAAAKALLAKRQRHQAETERSLGRLRSAILATVPHELRTPLTSILGLTQLIIHRRGRYTEDRLYEMVQGVQDAASRLARTITRMMEWSEMTAQAHLPLQVQMHTECPSVLAAQMLRDPAFRDDVQAAFSEPVHGTREGVIAGHALQIRLGPERVYCDSHDLRRMLTELIANALRYSRPGMPVGVTGKALDGERYAIDVANVGDPIPADFLQQIGALSQVDRARNEQQGVGLGLALTRMWAWRNGATFGFERHDGHPTIARIVLRLAPGAAPGGVADAGSGAAVGGG